MQKPVSHTLWTRDFTILTLGTIISAIGGVGLHTCLQFVVIDNTSSPLLAALFGVASWLPTAIVSILASPTIDRTSRKKWIYGLDFLYGFFMLGFTWYIWDRPFEYVTFVVFSLVGGIIGAMYQLAFNSLFPDVVPEGFAQKGFSIASLIYPSIAAIIAPVAMLTYRSVGIRWLFLAEGILLIISACVETLISVDDAHRKTTAQPFSLKRYTGDMKAAWRYLREEKGIRSIYSYMTFSNAAYGGQSLMVTTQFKNSPALGATRLGFLTTAETIGRIVGGVFHYVVKIPFEKRYWLAVRVYNIYAACDGVLLFVAYPIMLVLRFFCGLLGINSATLRESATQNYIPSDMRARVASFFSVMISLVNMVVVLLIGWVGEHSDPRYVALGIATVQIGLIYFMVSRNRKPIAAIYNLEH